MKKNILLRTRLSTSLLLLLVSGSIVFAQTNEKVVCDFIDHLRQEKQGYFTLQEPDPAIKKADLPIGVFDSGTGGLTVLNAIFNLDSFQNFTGNKQADGIRDFSSETFVYLGDLANMPYGNYAKEEKTPFLQELILKDVHFLINNQFYQSRENPVLISGKLPVKTIVIACNTASAYGIEFAKTFLEKLNVEVHVIGVIDAGVKAALDNMGQNNGIVGVLATEGTVMSGGYEKALMKLAEKRHMDVLVVSQGGLGIAEALDGDVDYYLPDKKVPDDNHKGPVLEKEEINKDLFAAYRFDFSDNKMVCDHPDPFQCDIIQINDPENYMRYHLVSLLEKIKSKSADENKKIETLILGCTHYPYMEKEINKILNELYDLQDKEGDFVYRRFMAPTIKLIDPSVYTAIELYSFLHRQMLLSESNQMQESSFYVSIPNPLNNETETDNNNKFTYAYKYGRKEGSNEEYVIRVPFAPAYFEQETMERLKEFLPEIYPLLFQSAKDE